MRAWNGWRKSRLLRRKQTISARRLRIRRACALGRNPRRRMAASTRARVSRLTWELEFSTREIVPMPTEAACATSRIVVFLGTASMAMRPFVALAVWLGSVRNRQPFSPEQSLTHQNDDGIARQSTGRTDPAVPQEVGKRMQDIGFARI